MLRRAGYDDKVHPPSPLPILHPILWYPPYLPAYPFLMIAGYLELWMPRYGNGGGKASISNRTLCTQGNSAPLYNFCSTVLMFDAYRAGYVQDCNRGPCGAEAPRAGKRPFEGLPQLLSAIQPRHSILRRCPVEGKYPSTHLPQYEPNPLPTQHSIRSSRRRRIKPRWRSCSRQYSCKKPCRSCPEILGGGGTLSVKKIITCINCTQQQNK